MRAAVLRDPPSRLEIEEVFIDAPGPHEVLVRVVAAGVCHSDLHYVEALYPTVTPTVCGHESAGIVEAVGDHVAGLAPGDHVITCLSVFCGHCELCLSGRPSLCESLETQRRAGDPPRLHQDGQPISALLGLGSFAEFVLVHEHGCVKIDTAIPLDRAALIGCAVTTGLGAVFRTARVEPGQSIAVIGCGAVGLNCVQGAMLAGATRIIAIDPVASKLELAQRFGATDLVDVSEVDPVAAVRELTAGGVDHAFEAVGLKATAEQAFSMIKRGGTATLIGMIPVGTSIELPGVDFLSEKRVQGCDVGSNRFRIDMPRYVDLYLQGRLKLDELVTTHIRLEQVNEAFDAMRAGEVVRSVIIFES